LGTTTEIGLAHDGIGELRLLMPALSNVLNEAKPNAIWVSPPYQPYSPALISQHIDPNHLIISQARNMADTLWAAEQSLLSNSCGALFTWTGKYHLSHKESRRLQLAAAKSNTWHVHFRHHSCLQNASAARLRLRLDTNIKGELSITITKQPLGIGGQQCTVSLPPYYQHWQRLSATQLPQHNRPLAIKLNKATQRVGSATSMLRQLNVIDDS